MPSKSSKAASKQAKLTQKKRRGKGAPAVITASIIPTPSEMETGISSPNTASTTIGKNRAGTDAGPSHQARRAQLNTSRAAVAAPTYLNVELRQIGLLSGLIVALLVALTFVLG